MTTIGYGIPYNAGSPFEDEATVLAVIWLQAMLDPDSVGWTHFARLSRASNRASQIIFSDKAVVRCVRGRHYLFRVAEASFGDYTPAVEAHVRLQPSCTRAVTWRRAHSSRRAWPFDQPERRARRLLFLATPQVVSHRIDPLSPPRCRRRPPPTTTALTMALSITSRGRPPRSRPRGGDGRRAAPRPLSRGGAVRRRPTRCGDARRDWHHIQRSEVESSRLVEAIDPFTSATSRRATRGGPTTSCSTTSLRR